MSALNSSECGLSCGHRWSQSIPMRNSPLEKRILQGITISLGPAILRVVWWPGRSCTLRWVKYLSLSIDIIPQWILWKKSRENWSLRASRVGHCSSSRISPTLLVLRHLLQVQRAAVLCTFSTCYTPRKLCLWWVYCFHVVRPCVRAYIRPSVRNALFP